MGELDNFVMVKFTEDEMVVPIESSWFGYYKPGQDKEIVLLQNSSIYLQVVINYSINRFPALIFLWKNIDWRQWDTIKNDVCGCPQNSEQTALL